MYPSPVADHSLVVTITLMGMVDDPPDIITTNSTNPDDSVATNRFESNTISNTTEY